MYPVLRWKLFQRADKLLFISRLSFFKAGFGLSRKVLVVELEKTACFHFGNTTQAIRCTLPGCPCECFSPGKTVLRLCESCKHGWVAHALDKLGYRHIFNLGVQVEIVQPNIVFDIASLMLYGAQATPIRLKILLDRLFSVLQHEEVLQVLHGFGWTYEDYARGYILQEQGGRVLDKWTIANREEEHIIIQQFLRFGETKSIAQEIILQDTRERQDLYIKQTSRNESEIKKFIERSNFSMQGFIRPFDARHLFGNRLPFVPPGNRLLSPPLPGFSPPTSRDLRPPVITVGSTSPGTTSPLGRLQTMQPFDFRHENSSPSISPGQIVNDKVPILDHSPRSESPQNLSITSTSSPSSPPTFTPQKKFDAESPLSSTATAPSLSLSAPAMILPMMPRSEEESRVLNFSIKEEGNRHHHSSSVFADKKVKHLRKSSNPIKRQWLPTTSFGTTMIGPNGKKRVLCTACNKTFCDKGALKIHYSAVHLKEMHKCSVEGCTMMFSSRRSRNRHSANPNPKLHMPQKRPKMPDGVTIVDDGSGSTPTRPLSSPPSMITAGHSPVNMMDSPEKHAFYADPNFQLPLFPTVAKRIKLDFDEFEDGPKDLSLPLMRREQENRQIDTPTYDSPDSSSSDSEKQDTSTPAGQKTQSRRKNIPSRCAQPSDLYRVSDDKPDDNDPAGKGQTQKGDHLKKVDQNGCSSPSGVEDKNQDQQCNDDDKGKNCDSSSDKNVEQVESSDNKDGPFEKDSYMSDHSISAGALDFSKNTEAENEENLSVCSEQENSVASNESGDYSKSNGDLSTDFEIPIDKDDPRKCTSCGKSFLNHFTLKIHYKNVHLKLLHSCTVEGCNAAFPSKRSRDRHAANLNLHRKLLSTSDKLDTDDNQNFRADIIQKLYESQNTDVGDLESGLENRVNGHKVDDVRDKSDDEIEMGGSLSIVEDEPENDQDEEAVVCHICQTKVRDNLILKEHYELNHPKEMFPCTIKGCEKTFSTRKSRNHHSQNDNLHRNISPNRRTVVV